MVLSTIPTFCEGGELFGVGQAKGGMLGNPELKTNPDTPILIYRDVEMVFSGPISIPHLLYKA